MLKRESPEITRLKNKCWPILLILVCFTAVFIIVKTMNYQERGKITFAEMNEITQHVTNGSTIPGSTVIELIHRFQLMNLQIVVYTKDNSKGKIYNWNYNEQKVVGTYENTTLVFAPDFIYSKGVFYTEIVKGKGGEYETIVFTQQ